MVRTSLSSPVCAAQFLHPVKRHPRLLWCLKDLICAVVLSILVAYTLVVIPIADAQECALDADCRPAVCCRGTACVPAAQAAASCTGTSCGCEPFTLDCGGRCICTATKKCAAVLNENSGGVSAGNTPVVEEASGSSGRRRRRKGG